LDSYYQKIVVDDSVETEEMLQEGSFVVEGEPRDFWEVSGDHCYDVVAVPDVVVDDSVPDVVVDDSVLFVVADDYCFWDPLVGVLLQDNHFLIRLD